MDVRPLSYYHYIPDFIPVRRHAMDNLEYHMMNDSSANNNQPMPPFQRLSNGEDDSEYMSHGKRELIASNHHRNETTV